VPSFVVVALCASMAAAQSESSPAKLFIQVKAARLREAPKHWAAGVTEVSFGAEVAELSREGDWLKVREVKGSEGYLHASAVTARRVVFKGATEGIERIAEPTDVVLAGKGFASQLETMFRSGEPGLDYAAVDRLEQQVLDGGALEKFLRAGKLRVDAIERGARG